jgi:hypothetical protein
MQILTPTGFQDFEGINRYWHDKCLQFTFEDGSKLKTAFKHRFIVDGKEVFSKDLQVGANIGKTIDSIEVLEEPQYFFDPLNVDNGSVFCHDDKFVSHNSFLGNGMTLISGDVLLGLKARSPIYTQGAARIYKEPDPEKNYIMTVDVAQGRGQDYSTFNIIDIDSRPFEQVAVYQDNNISPLLFPMIIEKYARIYNNAFVVLEANDQGSVVGNILYQELEYEEMYMESTVRIDSVGVRMNKKIKRIGCSTLKDIVEEGKINLYDAETIIELSSFEARGNSFEAANGGHDDLSMNLVLFSWFTTIPYFTDFTDINIKEMVHAQNMKMIEEDIVPFGIIDDGVDRDYETDSTGTSWFTSDASEWS